jgi:hypothetical protein
MMRLSERTYLDSTGPIGIECRYDWDPALLDAVAASHRSVSSEGTWPLGVKLSRHTRGGGSEW